MWSRGHRWRLQWRNCFWPEWKTRNWASLRWEAWWGREREEEDNPYGGNHLPHVGMHGRVGACMWELFGLAPVQQEFEWWEVNEGPPILVGSYLPGYRNGKHFTYFNSIFISESSLPLVNHMWMHNRQIPKDLSFLICKGHNDSSVKHVACIKDDVSPKRIWLSG